MADTVTCPCLTGTVPIPVSLLCLHKKVYLCHRGWGHSESKLCKFGTLFLIKDMNNARRPKTWPLSHWNKCKSESSSEVSGHMLGHRSGPDANTVSFQSLSFFRQGTHRKKTLLCSQLFSSCGMGQPPLPESRSWSAFPLQFRHSLLVFRILCMQLFFFNNFSFFLEKIPSYMPGVFCDCQQSPLYNAVWMHLLTLSFCIPLYILWVIPVQILFPPNPIYLQVLL